MLETTKQPKNSMAIHPFRDPSSVCLKPKTSLNNKSKAPFRCCLKLNTNYYNKRKLQKSKNQNRKGFGK